MIQTVRFKWFLAVAVLGSLALAAVGAANGATITHGTTTINMDFVTVGNPGNPDHIYNENYGGVDYVYDIGRYEVSENQWDAVVDANAGDLLSPGLSSTGYWSGDQPVGYVSYNEAAMFCNWLTSGDVTEGAYQIKVIVNGQGFVESVDKIAAESQYGTVYYLPTADEWYKAAYYDPNKPGGPGYWDYPTMDDDPLPPDGIDSSGDTQFDAVFADGYTPSQPNNVDNAGLLSAYGTMGQGGNVLEWNDHNWGSNRGVFGGSYVSNNTGLHAAYRGYLPKTERMAGLGFRVATSTMIPEPGSIAMLAGLAVMGLIWWRRRRHGSDSP